MDSSTEPELGGQKQDDLSASLLNKSENEELLNSIDMTPINGLRGIGSLCIACYHYFILMAPTRSHLDDFPVFAPEFMSVVTLFFVISGFTLTSVYYKDDDSEKVPLKPFLVKRMSRLAPVYYFGLLIGLWPFIIYSPPFGSPAQIYACIPITLLWLQSLLVQTVGWDLPLWQASAFAFLYPCFPSALHYLKYWTTQGLSRLLGQLMVFNVVFVLCGVFVFSMAGISVGGIHREVLFRYPQFIMGIAAGLIAKRCSRITGVTWKAEACTSVLALSSLVICPILVATSPTAIGGDTWDYYSVIAEFLVSPIHALWIIYLSHNDCRGVTRWFLQQPIVQWLGDISFSVYCIHAPLLWWAAWTIQGNGIGPDSLPYVTTPGTAGYTGLFVWSGYSFFPLLAVQVLFGAATHYLIENPMRDLLNHWLSEKKS